MTTQDRAAEALRAAEVAADAGDGLALAVIAHTVSLVIAVKAWGEQTPVGAFAGWPGLVAAVTAYAEAREEG